MTDEHDLLAAIQTAAAHCQSGGVALFCPDETIEIFEPYTDHGGIDAPDGRGIRYLEWGYDPDPSDHTYVVEFSYLIHEPEQTTRALQDRHLIGLFPRQTWLDLLNQAGFTAHMIRDSFNRDLFVGVRR